MGFWTKIILLLAFTGTCIGQREFEIVEITDPTVDKKIERPAGGSMQLTCTIEGEYNGAIHTIRWKKAQPKMIQNAWELNPEEYAIAAQTSIDDGWPEASRFRIEYNDPPGQHVYKLIITDLQPEDSGRYRCYGEDDTRAHNLIYRVHIQTPPTETVLSGSPDSSDMTMNDTTDGENGPLVYYTNKHGFLSCTTRGAYPPPILHFYVNDKDGNRLADLHDFVTKLQEEDQLVGSVPGLQTYNFEVTKSKDSFQAKSEYNGGQIICEVQVADSLPNTKVSRAVEIRGPPQFVEGSCAEVTYAELGEEVVALMCRFQSTPAAKSYIWTAESTGEELIGNDQDGSLTTTLVQVTGESNIYEARLVISAATEELFQTYSLVVENEVGWSESKSMKLIEGEDPGKSCDPEDESCGAPPTAALFTAIICLVSIVTTAMLML